MSERDSEDGPRRIKSVGTISDILRTIQFQDAPTFVDVVDAIDLSKGTVHTYLSTLEAEGFVTREEDVYRLGVRFIPMAETVRNETRLYRAAREEVETLARETEEYVHLTVADRNREVTIDERRGDNAIAMDYHLRMREAPQHLHYTSTGKAMLAHFAPERVDRIIETEGLVAQTDQTITDREELAAELADIRDRGFAVNDEEEVRGMRSVGAVVRGIEDDVAGAISVTAPKRRLSGDRFHTTVPELVMQAANIIEVNLETAVMDV
ncbi:MAG: IclR family transcriptional regulator [Halobacteriota archaeon]